MSPLRHRLHEIIFEADTPAGKGFDVLLLLAIVLSVLSVMLESVDSIAAEHGVLLNRVEWTFTLIFTLEYWLRLWVVQRPIRYALSFFGLVDLLAVIPTYLSLFVGGAQSLLVIRVFRLLRVFRVLKLTHFLYEAQILRAAMLASLRKIIVFLFAVLSMAILAGTVLYLVEGSAHGFTSIPRGMYWAIVTLTTVGYGDIHPATPLGQMLASILMILGYGIIAVPTGIVSAELVRASRDDPVSTQACPSCSEEGHAFDAVYCKGCGAKL
jgi:voltage-gated potassium channel